MARSTRGLGAEHDIVAQRVEAADQAPGGAVLVEAVEEVAMSRSMLRSGRRRCRPEPIGSGCWIHEGQATP
jgi:hypothetical protein